VEYTVEFSLTRQGSDLWLIGSLYQLGILQSTHAEFHTSPSTFDIGMLGMHANSSTFGSTTASGQGVDNGLTFSRIEIIKTIPEPTTFALAGFGLLALSFWRRNR
jgi:hypothetical protein